MVSLNRRKEWRVFVLPSAAVAGATRTFVVVLLATTMLSTEQSSPPVCLPLP